ncbi:MAG: FlgD immunoglobulin-like domain containing protein [Candidatus Zixiibacteriota bacterium]
MIEEMIFHRPDSATCPTVDFMPFADSPFDITDTGSTEIEEPDPYLLPEGFALYQNFPNPFNASTKIKFEVPRSGKITLIIYNTIGQKITTLAEGYYHAGLYQIDWDGHDDRGRTAASGIYFYGLFAEESSYFKKMILLK